MFGLFDMFGGWCVAVGLFVFFTASGVQAWRMRKRVPRTTLDDREEEEADTIHQSPVFVPEVVEPADPTLLPPRPRSENDVWKGRLRARPRR